jgi:hypothetical protein
MLWFVSLLVPAEPVAGYHAAATEADAVGIRRIVIRALRETNAKDYQPEVISALVSNFSPERVACLIANRPRDDNRNGESGLSGSDCVR